MKRGSFWSWSLGVGLAALPLIGGCLRTVSPAPETTAAVEPAESEPASLAPEPTPTPAAPAPPPIRIESAAVTPVPAEVVLPENVQPNRPLAELIRLAHAGTSEAQLISFVANSPNPFNARADDIVYLNDIGVPENVMTALLQRDEQLKGLAAAAPAAPEASAPQAEPAAPVPYAAAPTFDQGALPQAQPEPEVGAPDYGPEPAPLPAEEVGYPEFYGSLAPYGSWMDVAGYGYCWQPAVTCFHPSWQPYCDGGGWVYTQCGWYWRSDYSWGWAPFHYGRWFHHDRYGWCWRPDSVWGASWVCWRYNSTHCGWAPLPPGVRYTPGVALSGQIHQVTRISPNRFRFVAWGNFRGHHLEQHTLAPTEATHVYNHTVAVTRIVPTHAGASNDGLPPERVAAATRVPVTRITLRDVQPGASTGLRLDHLEASGRSLGVYRPRVTSVPKTDLPTLRQPRPTSAPAPAPRVDAAKAPTSTQPRVLGQSPPHPPIILRGPDHPSQANSSPWEASVPNNGQPRTGGHPTVPSLPEAPSPSAWPDQRANGRSAAYPYGRQQHPSTASAPTPGERWSYGSRPGYHAAPRPAPEEVQDHGSGRPERPTYDAAPAHESHRSNSGSAERPSRAEPSESHASRPEPAPAPAPAASSHSQSSSDRSGGSDHSSRGGR